MSILDFLNPHSKAIWIALPFSQRKPQRSFSRIIIKVFAIFCGNVGAGKGRMLKFLLRLPLLPLQLSPTHHSIWILWKGFSNSNFEAHCFTLEEYYKGDKRAFDLCKKRYIYI
jgi:hypothetical protein